MRIYANLKFDSKLIGNQLFRIIDKEELLVPMYKIIENLIAYIEDMDIVHGPEEDVYAIVMKFRDFNHIEDITYYTKSEYDEQGHNFAIGYNYVEDIEFDHLSKWRASKELPS